jgi:hypothetical protein
VPSLLLKERRCILISPAPRAVTPQADARVIAVSSHSAIGILWVRYKGG